MSGERAGPYRLLELLGHGGMGNVYRALDPGGRPVALKRIEHVALTRERLARFVREASVRIEHPNVVRTLGAGMDASARPYVVLELLEGRTVAQELRRGLSIADVIDVGVQTARGLSAIHAAGLVHRDIKPSNLFRCTSGLVKVLDFGVAAALEPAQRMTATGSIIGTTAYLSPEQARGQRDIDARADLFALGVVLFEALTGEPPFLRDTTIATLLSIAIAPTPGLGAPAPEALAAVVRRCLQKSPAARFASAAELERGLQAVDPLGPPAEQAPDAPRRVSALLLADAVDDPERFARVVRDKGGEPVLLAEGHAAAVFDEREEIVLAATLEARAFAPRLGLSMGPPVGEGAAEGGAALTDRAIREAVDACGRADDGVVTGTRTARMLAGKVDLQVELDELEPGLFALRGSQTSRPPGSPRASPLVGREAELAMLERARDTVLSETRAVVTWLIGPPGCGKSRLTESASGLAAQVLMQVRGAHALPRGERMYGVLLRALAGATDGTPPSRSLDPQASSDQKRAEVLARLRELALRGSLALVLDDLQWADAASLGLLEELPDLLGDLPLWIVLGAREELRARSDEAAAFIDAHPRIEPSALRAADVLALCEARGGAHWSARAAQALAEHTGGNPLFVEQLLDAADPARIEGGVEGWPLPPSIELAVHARLSGLPEHERDCSRILSIFGRPAAAGEVQALGARDAQATLSSLIRRGIVARAIEGEERAFRFRSPLVGDAVYRTWPEAELRALHRAAADVALARGRGAEERARHLELAGELALAGELYAEATLEAARRGQSDVVLRCAASALRAGAPPERAFAVHFARAEAARFAGDTELQERSLDLAAKLADDDRERALAASEHGELLRRRRRLEDALESLDRAVELARGFGDAETHARAVARRAIALVAVRRGAEAAQNLDALPTQSLAADTAAIVHEARGYVAGSLGDLSGRRRAFERAADLHQEAGDLRRAASAQSNRADADNRLGRYDEAQLALQSAIEMARRVGNRLAEGYALANLGYALTASGDADRGLRSIQEALAIARATDDGHLEMAAHLYAGRARLALGPTHALGEQLDRLATSAAGDPTVELNARVLACRAWLALGDIERGAEQAKLALELYEAQGSVEEGEGEVFVTVAQALDAAGLASAARRLRERGRARLLEVAARITDPAERAGFLERVPEHRALLSSGGG